MTDAPMPLPSFDEYRQAREHFLEMNGSTATMNNFLKVALFCALAACLGLIVLSARIYTASRDLKPLVIRINEIGRAERVIYDDLRYQPQVAEFKYFLIQFVQQHYGRMRATVRDNFSRSLYFLDGRLAEEIMSSKDQRIDEFLAGHGEEVDVQIRSVAVEDIRKAPYRATVEYDRIFYTPGSRVEVRREKYVGNFVFQIRGQVPNELIPVNPLGLTITYFREDQAFK